jgi:hypothetical protein
MAQGFNITYISCAARGPGLALEGVLGLLALDLVKAQPQPWQCLGQQLALPPLEVAALVLEELMKTTGATGTP